MIIFIFETFRVPRLFFSLATLILSGLPNIIHVYYNHGQDSSVQSMDYLKVVDQSMLSPMLIFFKKYLLINSHHFVHIVPHFSFECPKRAP